jgi:nitroreductase
VSSPIDVSPSTSVSDAIRTRRSIRAFKADPVPEDLVREIVETASRAASGGNLQPWRLYVLAGEARDALVDAVARKQAEQPFGDGPEYAIYPADLSEPYRARRKKVALDMYGLAGVDIKDRDQQNQLMARNFRFFDAPIGMFVTIDKQMGPPQFSDLGMFITCVMLLARERGLHTCPQEAWSLWGATIREVVEVPDNELIFCGISLGYADDTAPVNTLHTERASIDDFTSFRGF